MKKTANRKTKTLRGLLVCFAWSYAVISLYPLIWMLFYSLKTNDEIFVTNPFGFPKELHWENYTQAISQYNVPVYFINSILVSTATALLTIICALLFSYATTRMRFKGRRVLENFVGLGMFIPVQAIMIPVVKQVQKFHLLGTRWSLIIPYVALNIAFACMVYCAFLRDIPTELEEAACMDGATIFQTFRLIMVPLLTPATATVGVYVFLNAWNEFILANVLVGSISSLKTLPLGVLFFQGQFSTNWGGMGATMVIASVPAVIVYTLFSEQVERAMTIGGAVKG